MTHIQIGDTTPRRQFDADGEQLAFDFTFPIFQDDDLDVYVDQAQMVLDTDYSVTGAGESAGGTVTFFTAPANNTTVTLVRRLAIQRTTDFQESGELRSKVLNDELDYQTAALQQVADDASRGVRLHETDAATDMVLPAKADRADRTLGFDANGAPVAGPSVSE
ncbi:MAG: hypothetical protein KDE22_09300, partial [Rhodobacterales bacterium]|nr:hypothetical protein [Rhodobacterales bacterium]